MNVLGVGLSRTGTTSLHRALEILGLKCLHYDALRLNDILLGHNPSPNFNRYDDLDAVTDLPTAMFYREIIGAYPGCKVILTVRDIDSWWGSMLNHYNSYSSDFWQIKPPHVNLVRVIRELMWGSATPNEYICKKRFREHNEAVLRDCPDALVMDITQGDGWEKLCGFLGLPVPDQEFPHTNKSSDMSDGVRRLRPIARA